MPQGRCDECGGWGQHKSWCPQSRLPIRTAGRHVALGVIRHPSIDEWICECGNDTTNAGFFGCDVAGRIVGFDQFRQPMPGPFMFCAECGRYAKDDMAFPADLPVVGYVPRQTFIDMDWDPP